MITRLTRLAVAATTYGRGIPFLDQVMRFIWDGQTDNWDQDTHLEDAILRAGIDPLVLENSVQLNTDKIEKLIEDNQSARALAGHTGVLLFVFDGEPFFGQDRFDILQWRMQQKGLEPRT